MKTTDLGWWPVAAGLATTALALTVVFGIAATHPSEDETAATTTAVAATTATTGLPAAGGESISDEPVVITTPPYQLDGISESISRVLSTGGFAGELDEADLRGQLPGSVYRTLVAHDVVLTVSIDGSGE